jgi:hypothetical protein
MIKFANKLIKLASAERLRRARSDLKVPLKMAVERFLMEFTLGASKGFELTRIVISSGTREIFPPALSSFVSERKPRNQFEVTAGFPCCKEGTLTKP